jgi:hypothetical protein
VPIKRTLPDKSWHGKAAFTLANIHPCPLVRNIGLISVVYFRLKHRAQVPLVSKSSACSSPTRNLSTPSPDYQLPRVRGRHSPHRYLECFQVLAAAEGRHRTNSYRQEAPYFVDVDVAGGGTCWCRSRHVCILNIYHNGTFLRISCSMAITVEQYLFPIHQN